MVLEFSNSWFTFGGTDLEGIDDTAELLSIVSALLMILLNANNILALTSSGLVETPSLGEFHVDMEDGVRHMDNINSASIAALHFF